MIFVKIKVPCCHTMGCAAEFNALLDLTSIELFTDEDGHTSIVLPEVAAPEGWTLRYAGSYRCPTHSKS